MGTEKLNTTKQPFKVNDKIVVLLANHTSERHIYKRRRIQRDTHIHKDTSNSKNWYDINIHTAKQYGI